MSNLRVSARLVVDAPAVTIFEMLSDPRQHARCDGSESVRSIIAGPERLFLGAVFSMAMRIVIPYRMTNTVVEFDDDRLIAWHHTGSPHRWRYELTPTAGGTRIMETWDASRVARPLQWLFRLVSMPARNLRGIRATLLRLKQAAEATAWAERAG